MRTKITGTRGVGPRLLFICCLAATCCQGQLQPQQVLELPYPERKTELRAEILKLDEPGVQAVVSDIRDKDIKTSLDLARKSFLIDVILDLEDRVATTAVEHLLDPNVDPTVVMLTIRRIAHQGERGYLGQLARLLDDERTASIVSSPTGDRPVSVRHEVIQALTSITNATPAATGASEEEQAAAWHRWLAARQ